MIHLLLKGGDMMKVKTSSKKIKIRNDRGNIMLITTIIILILTIIVASCLNVAGMEYKLSTLERNTSNTYYIAEAGLEKQVETINKALEIEIPSIVKDLNVKYIGQLKIADDLAQRIEDADGDTIKFDDYKYENSKITVVNVNAKIREEIYKFLKNYYFVPDVPTADSPKPIKYEVESDREDAGAKTYVTVTPKEIVGDNTQFEIIVESVTKNGTKEYDKQKVRSIVSINIPADIEHQVREYYKWVANPAEILDSPLICFSDVIVEGPNNKLIVDNGDVLVKGIKQMGGTTIGDVDQSGGVVAMNGGQIYVKDNLYCLSNVEVTNGWSTPVAAYNASTKIAVDGDIIAHTVGIVDDFYTDSDNQVGYNSLYQGYNMSIQVDKNIIVDNDVMIDKFVHDSNITVTGTIFGTGAGIGAQVHKGGIDVVNPNSSSGVFAQGDNTFIKADRMFVAGQPFVTLDSSKWPLKLFESIGEPFTALSLEYATATTDTVTNAYLSSGSSVFGQLKADKIITHIEQSDAVESISATEFDTGTEKIGFNYDAFSGRVFDNDQELWKFLYMGGSSKTIGDYTMQDYNDIKYIFDNTMGYYNATKSYVATNLNNKKMYSKVFTNESSFGNHLGIKAYSVAMRSIFFGKMLVSGELNELTFDKIVNLSSIPVPAPSLGTGWSYDTPIAVVNDAQTIDISDYYCQSGAGAESCYPTIIINKSTEVLTIKTDDATKNEFNGIIISRGPVHIVAPNTTTDITINGSLIIGGPEKTSLDRKDIFKNKVNQGLNVSGKVTLKHDPNMLFGIECKDRALYRKVLDALKLTQYGSTSDGAIKSILGPYSSTDLEYTIGKVAYSDKSYLWIDTEDIDLTIKTEVRE